uniref:Uncharacterized protein n=1 Tax=Arcella intermedia TaxID=1963864 RepID=A0A6B2L2X2_9EUKA
MYNSPYSGNPSGPSMTIGAILGSGQKAAPAPAPSATLQKDYGAPTSARAAPTGIPRDLPSGYPREYQSNQPQPLPQPQPHQAQSHQPQSHQAQSHQPQPLQHQPSQPAQPPQPIPSAQPSYGNYSYHEVEEPKKETFQAPKPVPTYQDNYYELNETIAHLTSQLQFEKSKGDHTQHSLEYVSQEYGSLKMQADNLEKQNAFLNQSLEQQKNLQLKTESDNAKLIAQLTQEKEDIAKEIEKERTLQQDSAVEVGQVKGRLEHVQKQFGTMSSDLTLLKSQAEKESVLKNSLEKENMQFREHWTEINRQIEIEKAAKVALARDVQEHKKVIRQLEATQNAILEYTAKAELLENNMREEQRKKNEFETAFAELYQKYIELDKSRATFDNLGVFSDSLVQTVPTFQTGISGVHQVLSEHAGLLSSEARKAKDLIEIITEMNEATKVDIQKQDLVLASLMASLKAK